MKRKALISLIGSAVVVCSLYFIVVQFGEHQHTLLKWRPDVNDLGLLGGATLVYTVANFLLAFAWIALLGKQQHPTPHSAALIRIYGTSQIAKYIPGNIMHIGGRHVLGISAGLSHSTLAFAAVYEIAGLLASAMLISLIGLQWVDKNIQALHWLPLLTPVLIAGYFLLPALLAKRTQHIKKPDKWQQLGLPLLLYAGFFLLAGLALLLLLLGDQLTLTPTVFITAFTAFAVSWTAGFITPGSPSGIGIRESILIILLTPLVTAELAIILAFLLRIVTVLGDVIFMLITSLKRSR